MKKYLKMTTPNGRYPVAIRMRDGFVDDINNATKFVDKSETEKIQQQLLADENLPTTLVESGNKWVICFGAHPTHDSSELHAFDQGCIDMER
jgi:hypothetical protein